MIKPSLELSLLFEITWETKVTLVTQVDQYTCNLQKKVLDNSQGLLFVFVFDFFFFGFFFSL